MELPRATQRTPSRVAEPTRRRPRQCHRRTGPTTRPPPSSRHPRLHRRTQQRRRLRHSHSRRGPKDIRRHQEEGALEEDEEQDVRGHVRKRGTTWTIVVDAGVDEKGRRKQQWRGGFSTRRDAERELARVLRSLQTGDYVSPSKVTLGEYLDNEWLPAVRGTIRPSTYRSYEMHVRVHIKPHLGTTPLQKLTGRRLNEFYRVVAKSRQRGRKPLSPATVRRVHAILHRALRDAVR